MHRGLMGSEGKWNDVGIRWKRVWMLLMCLASLDAIAAGSDYETESLDSVEHVEAEDPDALTVPDTTELDTVDSGRTHSLDSMEDVETEDPDKLTIRDTTELDDTPMAATRDSDASDAWSPTPCSQIVVHPHGIPDGSDSGAWESLLAEAEQHIRDLGHELEAVTGEYEAALAHDRTADRVTLGHKRDALRRDYSMARCELPQLVEDARRAGVAAEVRRPYEAPAGLR